MALFDSAWYVNYGDGSTTGYYAITKWATGTVIAAGALRRQNAAPAVGSERVFVCIVAGTTHATTEPTWITTRGGKTTDNTVTWQECTGIAALNGDATNTTTWNIIKGVAMTLGQVIKRNNGASYQICTTAGTAGSGSEPAFSDTAGVTTADNTVTWTSLGAVGNFTGWQAPHARLANAFTTNWGQAGNSFYIGDNHAETQASAMTLTSPGAGGTTCSIYCVNHSGSLPPVSANLLKTATISTTGNSALTVQGTAYYYGITFSCGDGANAPALVMGGNAGINTLEWCALKSGGTNSSIIRLGFNSASFVHLINTTLQFSATGSSIQFNNGNVIWRGNSSSIIGATLPTNLVTAYNSSIVSFEGVDLSALASGKTLFSNQNSTAQIILRDCKLGSSVTVASIGSLGGPRIDLIRCDAGATNYRSERYWFHGTQTIETTIVRTGGASDGTTPISWKLVTTANSKWVDPFESHLISIWNDTTGSAITVTLYGIWGGGAVPNNDDIWVEAEYLGASGNPQGSFITNSKADNLAAGSASSSDSSTWGGSTTKFKMAVTFTPQMKGPINIVVKAAKASSTFYIDPKPVLT